MGNEKLLKYANDKKPVEFTKEFKTKLDKSIQTKLHPEPIVPDDKDKGKSGDDE